MPAAVKLPEEHSAEALRGLVRRSKHANQSRRLLSLVGVVAGIERGEAARICGMDRQTLRDWVHRFNERGPEGLLDNWTRGPKSRLSPDQFAELAAIVETGPEVKTDGVVRWRRVGRLCGASRVDRHNSSGYIASALAHEKRRHRGDILHLRQAA